MKQVEYRKNIPPAQNVNVKCESDLQFRPHLISTKARIPFFVFFFLSLGFWTTILDFCGGFRWQLVPRLPFPVPRSPLPAPRFSNIPCLFSDFSKYKTIVLRRRPCFTPVRAKVTTCFEKLTNEQLILIWRKNFNVTMKSCYYRKLCSLSRS